MFVCKTWYQKYVFTGTNYKTPEDDIMQKSQTYVRLIDSFIQLCIRVIAEAMHYQGSCASSLHRPLFCWHQITPSVPPLDPGTISVRKHAVGSVCFCYITCHSGQTIILGGRECNFPPCFSRLMVVTWWLGMMECLHEKTFHTSNI